MAASVHALMQYAHHNGHPLIDAEIDPVVFYPAAPVALADMVASRRGEGLPGKLFEGCVEKIQVSLCLRSTPSQRRVAPDVFQITNRCWRELELSHARLSYVL